eukprot:COSAG06_NODE_39770_length_409_cov_0.541935_1_plen_26_part_10
MLSLMSVLCPEPVLANVRFLQLVEYR